jgi:SH3 domain protein
MLRIAAKGYGLIIYMALGLLLPAHTSWAGKAYVTEMFRISLRRGPSIENKILRFVSSGLPVEILESQDGWNRVQVQEEDGVLEGWVLSRYLVMRRPWKDQAEGHPGERAYGKTQRRL